MKKIPLSDALEPYRSVLETSQKPYIGITLKKEKTTWFQSKFGGLPYAPKNKEYPRDENGMPMFLLAQINFAEMPRLEPYPEKGILQFYISCEDDVYGIDFDDLTNQQNFRVVYHEEVLSEHELHTDFSFLPQKEEGDLPFVEERAVVFEPKEELVSLSDYQFEQTIGKQLDLEEEIGEQTLWDHYAEEIENTGHKIGGYAFFTQVDVREDDGRYGQHQHLLLQIDTDDAHDIMWGDAGVANFFITDEDLKNGNFSNVIYTWDCY